MGRPAVSLKKWIPMRPMMLAPTRRARSAILIAVLRRHEQGEQIAAERTLTVAEGRNAPPRFVSDCVVTQWCLRFTCFFAPKLYRHGLCSLMTPGRSDGHDGGI